MSLLHSVAERMSTVNASRRWSVRFVFTEKAQFVGFGKRWNISLQSVSCTTKHGSVLSLVAAICVVSIDFGSTKIGESTNAMIASIVDNKDMLSK